MRRTGFIVAALCSTLTARASSMHEVRHSTIREVARASGSVEQARLERPVAKKRHAKPAAHPVELVSINSHETFELVPVGGGGFSRKTMKALAHFLRCHHTQKVHAMSERLARLLYATSSHFDWARLEVVAGYRAPRIAKEKGNPKSPHKRGLACDFRIPGVTNETLRDYVRTYPKVGVGYYPNSGFVHLDVRDKVSAFWVDYSAPGARAQYSKTPEDDIRRLAQEKAEPADPSSKEGEVQDPQVAAKPGGATPNLPALVPVSPQNDD